MRTRHVLAITMALGLTLSAGQALAGGTATDMYGAREVATVRFIDRDLNLIQLADGTEIHATDPRMLDGIREGERVLVDFSHDNDTNTLNSIQAAAGDTTPGTSPAVLDGSTAD
jgi:hypothetical protein